MKRGWILMALAAVLGATLLAAAPAKVPVYRFAEYPPATGYVNARVLAANVAEEVTVPADCDVIVFGATAAFYLRADGSAAAVPSGDVTDGTASAYMPSARHFAPGDTFSLVAPATAVVTMECFDRAP
ncbi:MAG TPA: hypothetical protein PLS95_01050 [Thermoanaerobaculales bacterium]|jgi:hypothetical protein|nr:hypothetical protein [Thermoanaerobaculales bacterium]